MKKKTGIMILVLLLAVGFAAVSATLIIGGSTGFTTNSDEFDVIFTKAVVDGVDKSTEVIASDGKSISYTTGELSFIDDYSKLDFTVTNNSTQYDAVVSIECIGGSNAGTYYEITKNFASSIPAQTEAEGNVTVTMIRSSVNDIEETFTCTITGNAVERDTEAEELCNAETQITYEDTDSSGTRNIGDIVTISNCAASSESFYILSDDGTNTQMMSMYNLYVGGEYANSTWMAYENPTGIQDSTMLGYGAATTSVRRGVTAFSSDEKKGTNYSDYTGSIVEEYVNNYSMYLISSMGIQNNATLITVEELEDFGCTSIGYTCYGAPDFLDEITYWTRTAAGEERVWVVAGGTLSTVEYNLNSDMGVRPVVTIASSLLE